jgi:hypothetical protein
MNCSAQHCCIAGRKLAGEHAVKTMLFQQAISDSLGLNAADLICLSLLSDIEPLTVGQLAEATGLIIPHANAQRGAAARTDRRLAPWGNPISHISETA